jgi:RNA polymerase sigma-70 factor, ECF subfamily
MKSFQDESFDILIGERISEPDQKCPAHEYEAAEQSFEPGHPSSEYAHQIELEVNDLLLKHTNALSRYASGLSWDKTLVQDGLQEVFLRYFTARIRGQKMENPRAWLFRVLRNYLLDCNRKSSTMPAVQLKEAVQIEDRRQDVEAGYQQDETFRHILMSLSAREKECMQLRLEGFGYDEIAQILQIRTGTVGALLARGLKKIRNAGLSPRGQ